MTRIDMVNPGAASSRDGMRTRRVISIATPKPVAATGSSLSRPGSPLKTRNASAHQRFEPRASARSPSAQSPSARAARVDASSYGTPRFCDEMWHSSRADCANASHASALRTTRSFSEDEPDSSTLLDSSAASSAVSDAAATSSATPPPGTTRRPSFASVRWTRRTSRPTSPARASATSRTGWHRTAVTRRGVSRYVAER
mmetsp:Transcript_7811/g.34440  ORF Transcript_7811/g.34440 Transcript_7811/m.34440 type:complete len:200 (+) Transcript_7811:713-1312(+)